MITDPAPLARAVRLALRVLGAATLAAIAAPSTAAVIVDRSPDAIGFTNVYAHATNYTGTQNFLMQFTLAQATGVAGFSLYSTGGGYQFMNPGAAFTLKIRADDGGVPAAANLHALDVSLSAVDNAGSLVNPQLKRLHADFGPITLGAGTWWIGMASHVPNIGWNYEAAPGPGAYWLQGEQRYAGIGDQLRFAYRIYDASSPSVVPEPGTWALLITGFGLAGASLRRRAAVAA